LRNTRRGTAREADRNGIQRCCAVGSAVDGEIEQHTQYPRTREVSRVGQQRAFIDSEYEQTESRCRAGKRIAARKRSVGTQVENAGRDTVAGYCGRRETEGRAHQRVGRGKTDE